MKRVFWRGFREVWRELREETLQREFAKDPKCVQNLIRINLISLRGSLIFWISMRRIGSADTLETTPTERYLVSSQVGTNYKALIAIDVVEINPPYSSGSNMIPV